MISLKIWLAFDIVWATKNSFWPLWLEAIFDLWGSDCLISYKKTPHSQISWMGVGLLLGREGRVLFWLELVLLVVASGNFPDQPSSRSINRVDLVDRRVLRAARPDRR